MHGKMMIGASVILATLLASGCRERAAPQETRSQGAEGAVPNPAIAIDEATVKPVDAKHLAAATWTRHACSLDMIDQGAPDTTVAKGIPHVLTGFVLDQTGVAAGDFSVVLKGESALAIPTSTGRSRPDVVAYFKDPALAFAGFEFSTTFSSVPPGEYNIVFLLERPDQAFFCETGKKVRVSN